VESSDGSLGTGLVSSLSDGNSRGWEWLSSIMLMHPAMHMSYKDKLNNGRKFIGSNSQPEALQNKRMKVQVSKTLFKCVFRQCHSTFSIGMCRDACVMACRKRM
jgi:hypothetical protein